MMKKFFIYALFMILISSCGFLDKALEQVNKLSAEQEKLFNEMGQFDDWDNLSDDLRKQAIENTKQLFLDISDDDWKKLASGYCALEGLEKSTPKDGKRKKEGGYGATSSGGSGFGDNYYDSFYSSWGSQTSNAYSYTTSYAGKGEGAGMASSSGAESKEGAAASKGAEGKKGSACEEHFEKCSNETLDAADIKEFINDEEKFATYLEGYKPNVYKKCLDNKYFIVSSVSGLTCETSDDDVQFQKSLIPLSDKEFKECSKLFNALTKKSTKKAVEKEKASKPKRTKKDQGFEDGSEPKEGASSSMPSKGKMGASAGSAK